MTDLEPLINQQAFSKALDKLKTAEDELRNFKMASAPLMKIKVNIFLASNTGNSLESVPVGFLYAPSVCD